LNTFPASNSKGVAVIAPFFFAMRNARLVCWIAAVAACTACMSAALGAAAMPRAEIAQDRYDFGAVEQGHRITHAFTVSNRGAAELRFSGAKLSLPGMQVRMAPGTIAPGAQGTVTIDLATDHVAGAVEGIARIRSNDPSRPVAVLTLAGSVSAAISIEPIPAVFLSTFADEPAERVMTVRNHRDRPFELTGAEPGAHTTAAIATVERGKVYTVAVRTKPGAAPGRFEESLILQSTNGPITLPVHVWIKPDLYANPEAVDFGTVPSDSPRPSADATAQTVVLRRRAGEFEIESIASDVAGVTVTRTPATGRSNSFTLNVRLRPRELASIASLAGNIRVRTSDPRFPEIVIPVTGSLSPPAKPAG
jgi:hypothetical protein